MPISSPGTPNSIPVGIDQTDPQSVGLTDSSQAVQAYRAVLGQEAFKAQTEKVGTLLQSVGEMGVQLRVLGRDIHRALESGDAAGAAGPIAQYQALSARKEAAIDSLRVESQLLRAMLPGQAPGSALQTLGTPSAPAEESALLSIGSMQEQTMSAEGVPGRHLTSWHGAQAEAKETIKAMDQIRERMGRLDVYLVKLDGDIARAQLRGDQASMLAFLDKRDQLGVERENMQADLALSEMKLQKCFDIDWPLDDMLRPALGAVLDDQDVKYVTTSDMPASKFIRYFSSNESGSGHPKIHILNPPFIVSNDIDKPTYVVGRPRPNYFEFHVQDQVAKINDLKINLIKTQQLLTKTEFKIGCLLPDGDSSTLARLFGEKEAIAKGLERELATLEFAVAKLRDMTVVDDNQSPQ